MAVVEGCRGCIAANRLHRLPRMHRRGQGRAAAAATPPFRWASSSSTVALAAAVPLADSRSAMPVPAVTSSRREDVAVNVGSSGAITLNLHYPHAAVDAAGGHSPVVLFLPRGPLVADGVADEALVTTLSASMPSATVVRVNYRADGHTQFPIAVHDVLAAYDWVLQSGGVLPARTAPPRPRTPRRPWRIGVCGELIGGSLATMLALTECKPGRAAGIIAAAAVNSPVLDWTFDLTQAAALPTEEESVAVVDEEMERAQAWPPTVSTTLAGRLAAARSKKAKKKTKKKMAKVAPSWDQFASQPALSAEELRAARALCFRRPASYFDPFASPTLFFRSAGIDVPAEESEDGDSLPVASSSGPPQKLPMRRPTHRLYPPTGMGLQLPHMRLSIGTENPLHDQAAELVHLMRRSCLADQARRPRRRRRPHDDDDDDALHPADGAVALESEQDVEAAAERRKRAVERRIQLVPRVGAALWCSPRDQESSRLDLVEAGRWLGDALQQP
ncbi:MAG: hypothetical protein M1826_000429 [Phylliscum demangeonii]|nr:MAG: hypothetical protein M1826_000429 [Phylliscum demangeonii]